MKEELFDLPDEYESMLNQGLRLTGESRQFYIEGRLKLLRRLLPPSFTPARVLDFGCGTGAACEGLLRLFPRARIVGVDPSEAAVESARRAWRGDQFRFETPQNLDSSSKFDFCYINGVFHHIEPEERRQTVQWIEERLRPGALLALFDNNRWNPGTRLVMSRVPFDRDAKPLSPREARKLIEDSGRFHSLVERSFHWFPRALSWLRPAERWMERVPLGGQYLVLATMGNQPPAPRES